MENLNEQKGLLMKSHSSFFSALSNGVVLIKSHFRKCFGISFFDVPCTGSNFVADGI